MSLITCILLLSKINVSPTTLCGTKFKNVRLRPLYEKEMIFEHLFCDNFWTTFSLILTLWYILSPLFLTNKKREKEGCHKSCNKWLYKYHYSIWKYSFILPCYDELTPCLTCRSRIFKHFAIICIVFGGLWTARLLIPGWPKVYHVLGTWARTRAEAESSNISVTRFRTTIIR